MFLDNKRNRFWQFVLRSEGPPNLDELFAKAFRKISLGKQAGTGSGHSANAFPVLLVLGLLVVLWALSGIFIVAPAERGVVLRFGQYHRTVGPGPHWVPRLIDTEKVINVQRISTFSYESEMLTKDENIVYVALSVQFRIDDPKNYLFQVVNPAMSLQQVTASALRQVVGHTTLDELLTTGRALVRDQVAAQIKTTLALYRTGLVVMDVNLQPAKPPEAVTAAFDDAIKAREDEQRYINKAEAYAEKVVPIAQGQATRLRREAKAFQAQVVLAAKADTARYLALLHAFNQAPSITRDRLYFDAMQTVFDKVTKIVVSKKAAQPLLYLPMDRLAKSQPVVTSADAQPTPKAPSDQLLRSLQQELTVHKETAHGQRHARRQGYSA